MTTKKSLETKDIVQGKGKEASKGATVTVHYTGWLYAPESKENKGKEFDSSHKRNEPFTFLLGAGSVIKGWDQGFQGMKEGGKRVLIIPPEFGYGARAIGNIIPANSTLMFEVELISVEE